MLFHKLSVLSTLFFLLSNLNIGRALLEHRHPLTYVILNRILLRLGEQSLSRGLKKKGLNVDHINTNDCKGINLEKNEHG